MTTIKDIARQAGVSIATVSRVLNGQRGVSESKRQKVLAIAQELGFNSSKYEHSLKDKLPEILVFFLDPRTSPSAEEDIRHGIQLAKRLVFGQEHRIEVYTSDYEEDALELAQSIQNEGEELEGLIIIGNIPERFGKFLQYLRGRGCPVVFIEAKLNSLSPLTTVSYDFMSAFPMLEELILLLDEKRTGIHFHQSPLHISGEGYLSFLPTSHITETLQEHYPQDAIHIQNTGPYSSELFKDSSILILDSEQASLQAAKHYENVPTRPKIIAFAKGPEAVQLLQNKNVDALIQFSSHSLGFYGLYALGKRLIHKQPLPKDITIPPQVFFPSMSKILSQQVQFPILLDEITRDDDSI